MRCSYADCLFVYGTLRKGSRHPMHRVLAQRANFISGAVYQGRLYSLGVFPGAIPSDAPGDRVYGEVYRLWQAVPSLLRRLDKYEGCSSLDGKRSLFRRTQVLVTLESGQLITAWIYLYNRPVRGLGSIPSGRYKSR